MRKLQSIGLLTVGASFMLSSFLSIEDDPAERDDEPAERRYHDKSLPSDAPAAKQASRATGQLHVSLDSSRVLYPALISRPR